MKNALALLCLLPSLALAAAPQADKKAPARPHVPGVDWAAQTIRATGRGAPALNAPSIAAARIGAERAAEMDALRNILATLRGIRINSERTIDDAMKASDTLRAQIEGVARGFKRVDTRYYSDGGVEIDVEMSIAGMFAELIAPADEKPQVALPAEGDAVHTGLIVDARGLKPTPALSPRLLDEAGKELYGAAVVTRESLRANGIAGYLKSLEEARASARVGQKPLVVKAVKLAGASNLVLATDDAARLSDPKGNVGFLSEGRVIIVAD